MSKVLHITNWYPNLWNPHGTPFIKEYFDAAALHGNHELCHVEVKNFGDLFSFHKGQYADNQSYLILSTRINAWRVLELLHVFLLVWLRIREGRQWWDVVNVHIAYPLLRYPNLFRFLFGKNIVITEHWSAYRQGFYLPAGSAARKRIQKIFHYDFTVVTVSKALMDDVIRFAETDAFPKLIVPNVVNPRFFYPGNFPKRVGHEPVFLMVASWAPIKQPLLVMRAFRQILDSNPEAKLRIIGYGKQWNDMKAYVQNEHLDGSIELLGAMDKAAISEEMRNADAFLHASKYETFSVVCAEALCCGLPVIASNVGGIPEFVNASNGLLVDNTHEDWVAALTTFLQDRERWDSANISEKAISMFSPEVVGKRLDQIFLVAE